MKDKKTKKRNANSQSKTEEQSARKFSATHYILRFETHERVCGVVVGICALLLSGMGAVGFSSHKIPVIWTTGIGLCALIIAICFWLTDRELKHVTEQPPLTSSPMEEEYNISSNNQSGGFTGVNKGTVNQVPQPRILTNEQSSKLTKLLAAHPPGDVTFFIDTSATDSRNLASTLSAALTSAGIPCKAGMESGSIIQQIADGPETTGIDVGGPDPLRHELVEALKAVGLPAQEWPVSPPGPLSATKDVRVFVTIRKTPTA